MIDFSLLLKNFVRVLCTLTAFGFAAPIGAQNWNAPDREFSLSSDGTYVALRQNGDTSIIRLNRINGEDSVLQTWIAETVGDGFILQDAFSRRYLRIGSYVLGDWRGLELNENRSDALIWRLEGGFGRMAQARLTTEFRGRKMELRSGHEKDLWGLFLHPSGGDLFSITATGGKRVVVSFDVNMYTRDVLSGFAMSLDPMAHAKITLKTGEQEIVLDKLRRLGPVGVYSQFVPDQTPLPDNVRVESTSYMPLVLESIRIETTDLESDEVWNTKPIRVVMPGEALEFPKDDREVSASNCPSDAKRVVIATKNADDVYLSLRGTFEHHTSGDRLADILFCVQDGLTAAEGGVSFMLAAHPDRVLGFADGKLGLRIRQYEDLKDEQSLQKFNRSTTFVATEAASTEPRIGFEKAVEVPEIFLSPIDQTETVLRMSKVGATAEIVPRSPVGSPGTSRPERLLALQLIENLPSQMDAAPGHPMPARFFARMGLDGSAIALERWSIDETGRLLLQSTRKAGAGAEFKTQEVEQEKGRRLTMGTEDEGYRYDVFAPTLRAQDRISIPIEQLEQGHEALATVKREGLEPETWRALPYDDGAAITNAMCELEVGSNSKRVRLDLSLAVREISGCERTIGCFLGKDNLGNTAEWHGKVNFRIRDSQTKEYLKPIAIQTNRGLERSRSGSDSDPVYEKDSSDKQVQRIGFRTAGLHAYKVYDVPEDRLNRYELEFPSMTLLEADLASSTTLEPKPEFLNDKSLIKSIKLSELLNNGEYLIEFDDERFFGTVKDAADYVLTATQVCGGQHLYDPASEQSGAVINFTDETLFGLMVVYEPPRDNSLNKGPGATIGGGYYAVGFDVPPRQDYTYDMYQIDLSKAHQSITEVKRGTIEGVMLYRNKTERDDDLEVIEDRVTAGFLRTIADLLISAGGAGGATQLGSSTYALAAGVTATWIRTLVLDPLVGDAQAEIDAGPGVDTNIERQIQTATRTATDVRELAGACTLSEQGRVLLVHEDGFTCLRGSLKSIYATPGLCRFAESLSRVWREDDPTDPIDAYLAGCK